MAVLCATLDSKNMFVFAVYAASVPRRDNRVALTGLPIPRKSRQSEVSTSIVQGALEGSVQICTLVLLVGVAALISGYETWKLGPA
jgi:hypothetical protein